MTGIRSALAVALCAVATSVVAPATQGSPPSGAPEGRRCGFAATSDPAGGDDAMTGEVYGGPLVWDRDFWLHCHLRVDSSVHNGPVAADVHGPSSPYDPDLGTGAVAVVAERVDYQSSEDAQDHMCTAVSWPTATGPNWLHWRPGHDGDDRLPATRDDVPSGWTPDPGAWCSWATQASGRPLTDYVDAVVEIGAGLTDPRICAALIAARGVLNPAPSAGPQPGDAVYVDAEGDVFVDDGDGISEADWRDELFWDCPPYVDYSASPLQPGADGAPVIDVATGSQPGGVYSSVLGYVAVTMSPGDAEPEFTLAGELAVPARWSCSATSYLTSQPYTVTCDPVGVAAVIPECGVVQADVTTTSPGARARTAVYCDGDAVPEAKTHTVTGVGGHHSSVGSPLYPVAVTQLRCTVSNGAGAAPVPGFVAGCGDPGVVRVEAAG